MGGKAPRLRLAKKVLAGSENPDHQRGSFGGAGVQQVGQGHHSSSKSENSLGESPIPRAFQPTDTACLLGVRAPKPCVQKRVSPVQVGM